MHWLTTNYLAFCFFCLDLSAAVDVYSDWIDACDAVAKEDMMAKDEEVGGGRAGAGAGPSQPQSSPPPVEQEELGVEPGVDDEY